ncbi:MAG: NAD-dependent epimerase/dehydratase family protein [Chloroflexi bacterium]|nr:NAD-dependent epimerase/dehydratase family protein [Chloroflexota bacterium]
MADQELHVIFGTGPVGQATARELVKRGKVVKMINRSGKQPAGVPDSVTVVAGDVFDAALAKEVATGATHVYQCTNPAYHEWVEQFPTLQANTLEAAAVVSAKYIVMDNVYLYGDTNGQLIREDMPYNAHNKKGSLRARMAKDVLAAHESGKVRATIARASDFYGPGVRESAAGERVFGFALQGKAASVAGNLDAKHSFTYIDDVGKALVILGECDEALGKAWHVPNAPVTTTRHFIKLIFEELGQPAKMNSMGKLMLSIGGLFVPAAREMVEMLYEFEQDFVVDGSLFIRTFGLKATPYHEGIKATVAWYKANSKHARA